MGSYLNIGLIELNSKSLSYLLQTLIEDTTKKYKVINFIKKDSENNFLIKKQGFALILMYIDDIAIFDEYINAYYHKNYVWHEYNGDEKEFEARNKNDIKEEIQVLKNKLTEKLYQMVIFNKEEDYVCWV